MLFRKSRRVDEEQKTLYFSVLVKIDATSRFTHFDPRPQGRDQDIRVRRSNSDTRNYLRLRPVRDPRSLGGSFRGTTTNI